MTHDDIRLPKNTPPASNRSEDTDSTTPTPLPAKPAAPDGALESIYNDETVLVNATAPLLQYLRVVANQQLPSTALRQYVNTAVRLNLGSNNVAVYPSPARCWEVDPTYRQWVRQIGMSEMNDSRQNNHPFNLVRMLNRITNYNRNEHSFKLWHDKKLSANMLKEASWLAQQLHAIPSQNA